MFVLRSTSAALLAAKEAQIATLKDEVAFLRSCVRPVETFTNRQAFVLATEANAVLDGKQDQIDLSPDASDQATAVAEEASSVLAGTY